MSDNKDAAHRDAGWWQDYLRGRADEEGVELVMSHAELHGWCAGGVRAEDDPDEAYAALTDTLAGRE